CRDRPRGCAGFVLDEALDGCGIGSWGRCPSLADYVTGPEAARANVDYALQTTCVCPVGLGGTGRTAAGTMTTLVLQNATRTCQQGDSEPGRKASRSSGGVGLAEEWARWASSLLRGSRRGKRAPGPPPSVSSQGRPCPVASRNSAAPSPCRL